MDNCIIFSVVLNKFFNVLKQILGGIALEMFIIPEQLY